MNSPPAQRLFVIGDSHALYCYAGIEGARIYWLGAITLHRVGRDGVRSVLPRRLTKRVRRSDFVIFSFGEIDCRNHVEKIAAASATSWQTIVEDLAARSTQTIAEYQAATGTKVAIGCVVPPFEGETGRSPTQSDIRRYLNERLATAAAEANIRFIDFYHDYVNEDGRLRYPDSKLVHIDPQRTDKVANAVNQTFGTQFEYLPIRRDIFLYDIVAPRRRPKWLLLLAADTARRVATRSAKLISALVHRYGGASPNGE